MKTYIASLLVDDQSYEFTGSTKNATLSLSGNNKYALKLVNERNVDSLCFKKGKQSIIKKIRLRSVGAEGVVANDSVATKLNISIAKDDSGSMGSPVSTASIDIVKFNQWEEKNIPIGVDVNADDETYFMWVNATSISIMDFNVKDAFVGQTMKVAVDLEIESDGLFDATTGEAV